MSGAADYKWDYWETLAEQFKLPVTTAKHLAHKYGTRAPDVLRLADADPSLALPLVQGEAPIRAQVSYAVRHEMAQSMEDVLARRIGFQFYSWGLAIQAAPAVAEVLRKELGWGEDEEIAAIEQYVATVNHMLTSAGLEPVPVATGLVAGRR